ncbi:MAG: hypothetical protein ACPG4Z_01310 [Chitinophagales bacterium]
MLAGVVYIFLHKYYIHSGDIFQYFVDGNLIYQELFSHPQNYFRLVFGPNNAFFTENIKSAVDEMGFWWDTGAYTIVRFNAIVRLFSMGNIYIHGLFAGFVSFVGCFLLAKVYERKLAAGFIALSSIFIFPSLLFWTSGMHKEFVSAFSLGLVFYSMTKVVEHYRQVKYFLLSLVGLSFLFFARDYMMMLLIVPLTIYIVLERKKFSPIVIYSTIMTLVVLLACFLPLPFFGDTAIAVILEKRHQFESLGVGNTSIELYSVNGTLFAFLSAFPQSIFNVLFRPHFGDANTTILFLTAIDTFLISGVILGGLFYFIRKKVYHHNFTVFIFTYSLSLLVVIGLIVPNLGAIVRYRSTALLLLIPLCVHLVMKNFKKLE